MDCIVLYCIGLGWVGVDCIVLYCIVLGWVGLDWIGLNRVRFFYSNLFLNITIMNLISLVQSVHGTD